MNKRLFVVLGVIAILFLTPLVASAQFQCSRAVDLENDKNLVCWVSGNSNVSLKLVSVDNIKIDMGYRFMDVYDFEGNYLFSDEFGKPPLRVEVDMGSVLEYVAGEELWGYGYDWVLYNKVHALTFEVVHEDGRRETFTIPVYVYGSVLEALKGFLYFLGIIVGMVVVIYAVSLLWRKLRKNEGWAKSGYSCRGLTKGAYLIFIWGFSDYYKGLTALLIYFIGTPLTVHGDVILGWPVYLLILSILLLVFNYAFNCRGTKKGPEGFTGLEWIPLSMIMFGDEFFVLSLALMVSYFVLLRVDGLVEGMRKASIVASPIWAFVLGSQVNASHGMVFILMSLSVMYPLLVLLYSSVGREDGFFEKDGVLYVHTARTSYSSRNADKILDPNPPSAEELLARLESVVRKMEWEEKTLKRDMPNNSSGAENLETLSSRPHRIDSDWIPLPQSLGFTLAHYKSIKDQGRRIIDDR